MELKYRHVDLAAALSLKEAGYSTFMSNILAARGVKSAKEAKLDLSDLIPYDKLQNCVKFAEMLYEGIKSNKKFLIIADYDADGATAGSIGYLSLKNFGADIEYLIPHRIDHSYGLTVEIAKVAATQSRKPDVIITVDNGISSFPGIDYCNEQGIEVWVTDHHLEAEIGLPNAKIVVNPNQKSCTFPSKALAGCGVIFYCMWALQDILIENGYPLANWEFDVFSLLPIVAVGTIADVVSLDWNNRILVQNGLKLFKKQPGAYPWLEFLAKEHNTEVSDVTTSTLAFGVGPRINAAGRMDSMEMGVQCITTTDRFLAKKLAVTLNEINKKRKETESEIVEEATLRLLKDVKPNRYTTVLGQSDWHQGVIGIVASRIKDKTWRPTFIFTRVSETEYKGSGRSIPGFHLRDALDIVAKRVPGSLLKFGGHAMAAGASVAADKFEQFTQAFEQVAKEHLTENDLHHYLECDQGLSLEDICLETIEELKSYVWGQHFAEPVFLDVFEVVQSRLIGGGKHLSLLLKKDGVTYKAVKFKHEEPLNVKEAKFAYSLALDEFKGNKSVKLIIHEIQP